MRSGGSASSANGNSPKKEGLAPDASVSQRNKIAQTYRDKAVAIPLFLKSKLRAVFKFRTYAWIEDGQNTLSESSSHVS